MPERLAQLRSHVAEISPQQALAWQQAGALLIDVRDSDAVMQGSPLGALRLNRGFLELRIEAAVPDLEHPLITLCSTGVSSLFAAHSLQRMGYQQVASVAGGFERWQVEDLPSEQPRVMKGEERRSALRHDQARERYGRQMAIPEIGAAGQARLMQSKVLLVGIGGLGCPAGLYLAAAGVGTLGIVDDARVARDRLAQEILHTDRRVGQAKVDSARASLLALNPGIRVNTYADRLDSSNVMSLLAGHDLVVDTSTRAATRYLLNDACVRLGIPYIHGSVQHFTGELSVFWPAFAGQPGPCYRCLHPEPPMAEALAAESSAMEFAVLGVVPGIIGLLAATESIKLLLAIGSPLVGRMLHYDALRGSFAETTVAPDPECSCCGKQARHRT
ncbi:MAG: molybdopterin-synthase adenylyltransferase MoeB [Azonexus sp.]